MDMQITPTVAEIGKISFAGNITPPLWYKWIRKNKSAHLLAITLLSDIVYWYRPTVIRDEDTGDIKETRRKFKSDKLQKSYQSYADQFGVSKDSVRDAISLLVSLELITREFRNEMSPTGIFLSNVMYLEPIPAKIAYITFSAPPSTEIFQHPPSEKRGEVGGEKGMTYTEITTETTTNIFSSPSDECDFDSIPSASGKEVQKQEEPARMTADEYKTRVRAAMSNSGNKKRAVAEGKRAIDEDEVQVARILASVKDQQVLPSDLFRDKKNATAIIYRRAAKALIHEMKMMGRTLEDVKKTGDYFLNGGGERYRAPNVNYAAGTIAAHFAEHWRSETKKPTVVPAPVQKLKVPDYAR